MVITLSAPDWPPNGPRPINLKQDLSQVSKLLEIAFAEKMDREGQMALRTGAGGSSALMWWLNPKNDKLPPGYVWQENGRIVGNVTLIGTKETGRHIIANVAVHPDFRRRGIARALMEAVLAQVKARHGQVVLLQVVKENTHAIDLYESLQFEAVGIMTEWRSSISRLHEVPASTPGDSAVSVLPLPRHLWREAYQLDARSLLQDLNWPEPIPQDYYRQGFWVSLRNFITGHTQETWITSDLHGQITGLGTITADWGGPYSLSIRVHPAWRGQLERPLLAKLIRRLRSMGRGNVTIHHPDDDLTMNHLLTIANFSQRRSLIHMHHRIH